MTNSVQPKQIKLRKLTKEEKKERKKRMEKRQKEETEKKEAKRLKKETEKKEMEKYKKHVKKVTEENRLATIQYEKDDAERKTNRLKKLAALKSAIAYGIDCDGWYEGCFRGHLFNDWRQSEFDTLEEAIDEAIHFISNGEEVTGIVMREKKFGTKWALRTKGVFYKYIKGQVCKERTFDLCSGWRGFKKDE